MVSFFMGHKHGDWHYLVFSRRESSSSCNFCIIIVIFIIRLMDGWEGSLGSNLGLEGWVGMDGWYWGLWRGRIRMVS